MKLKKGVDSNRCVHASSDRRAQSNGESSGSERTQMAHKEHVPAVRGDHDMRSVLVGQAASVQDENKNQQLVAQVQRNVSLCHRQRRASVHVRDARVREGLLFCARGSMHRPQRDQARRCGRARLVRVLATARLASSHGRHRLDHTAHLVASTKRRACQRVCATQVGSTTQRRRLNIPNKPNKQTTQQIRDSRLVPIYISVSFSFDFSVLY